MGKTGETWGDGEELGDGGDCFGCITFAGKNGNEPESQQEKEILNDEKAIAVSTVKSESDRPKF